MYSIDYFHGNPDTMFALGSSTMMSTDKGETWTVLWQYGFPGKLRAHPKNSKVLYLNYEDQLTGSNDFAVAHIDTGGQVIFSGRGIPSFALAVDYADSHTVYVGVADYLLRTTDGGYDIHDITPPGGRALDIAIAASNDSILYAACDGGVYKSTTRGDSWIQVFSLGIPVAVAVNPYNAGIAYVALYSYGDNPRGVYKTTDGGSNWRQMNNGLDSLQDTNWLFNTIAINPKVPEELYLSASRAGIYRSTDGGENWQPFSDGIPIPSQVTSIAIDTLNNRLYAGMRWDPLPTQGVYIYDGKPTNVLGQNINPAAAFQLCQNYPNPFNGTTIIRFEIPHSSNVSLKVYDLLGREISTLINNNLRRGWYQIPFDAGSLASGVYVYRLQAGGFIEIKRMTILK